MVIGRRGGKTEMLINHTVRNAVTIPGLHWIVAPSYRQVKSIVWTRLKQVLEVDKDWIFNEQELSATHPMIKTKIELRGADNEDSLRGVGLQSLGVDEAASIKANVWPEILRPMLADTQGPAMFIGTPKGRNWFYDLYTKKENDWQSWQYPTKVNGYISPKEIKEAQKDMSERLFQQEFEAEFLDDETGVFKGVSRCACARRQLIPREGRFYVMGVDLAKSVDFTVITVMDSVTREVVHFERFQDVRWKEQKLRIQACALKYNNALVVIDSTGVGEPIYEDLQNSNVSVEGYKFTNATKCKLIEGLAIAIEQRQVTFPPIDVLIDELKAFEYQLTQTGTLKYSAPVGKHDDCVISLALAVYGIRHYLHEAQVLSKALEADPIDKQGSGTPTYQWEETTSISGY